MRALLRGWLDAWLRRHRCKAPVDLSKIERNPAFDGEVGAALVTCLHPQGCWSYCTGGYRYCLCCNRVRVRC